MTIHLPLCSPINVENVRCAVRLLIASSALIIRPTAYLRTVQSIAGNSTSLSSVRISFTHLISVLHDSRQFPEQYGLYISYFIVSEVMLTELSWDSAPVTLTMPVLRAREASLDEDTHFYSRTVLYLGRLLDQEEAIHGLCNALYYMIGCHICMFSHAIAFFGSSYLLCTQMSTLLSLLNVISYRKRMTEP